MKIPRAKKTVAIIGLVFALILTSFALGLAQETSPFGPNYSFGLQPGIPDDASCLDGYALQLGLAPKAPDSSITPAKSWPQAQLSSHPFAVHNSLTTRAATKPRKISLYLLDSVLLI
jgi:hypothetical protein